MAEGLDIIIMDDDPSITEWLAESILKFYSWGNVYTFNSTEDALFYLKNRNVNVAVFVVDVFLEDMTGFQFLDALSEHYPMIYEDTVMITGEASDNIVNACLESGVTHLLEKPIRSYALQFAVRSVVNKYLDFAKKLLHDPTLVENIQRLSI
jgi:response regulator of citrate/malate metabolism